MTQFHSIRRMRICSECDLVVALPPLPAGTQASCPRCQHTLARRQRQPVQRVTAWALAALMMLAVALYFDFVSFSTRGIGETISLTDTVLAMLGRGEAWLAIVLTLTMVVLPGCYLIGLIYLHLTVVLGGKWPAQQLMLKWVSLVQPWLMADVFLIGALVSLVKVSSLAEIEFEVGFWAYGAFALLVIHTGRCIDRDWLWFALVGESSPKPQKVTIGASAAPQNLIGCTLCDAVNHSDHSGHCRRCGSPLFIWYKYAQTRTLALLTGAIILYIPAMLLPIMTTVDLSGAMPSTIVGGVIELWQIGSQPVAVIIFCASIVIPIAKIIALLWLVQRSNNARLSHDKSSPMLLYRVTDVIGRWSMIDVFVVAILVALIQAGALMSVYPGPAAAAFAGVVILTMLAAFSFDTRQLWWSKELRKDE
ncbi:paraquat-inducible protein A [Pseudidiomarina planktonica]|uniref:Paraquat-inducible protein A n=1 Tax=Pseudidiomarina planktonica TaxID=1323738 RepID=A0A1Y6EJV8_9GAMM|nr:paraquat-inducible protein A [Pseudidiomarina planktonica]RUO65770.1 paraquat-inducible protein A [Pseudidiomarina planktonica]SMQ62915.1 paraquat-inducible protein A [Pseudidiomarina planktonica]